MSEEQPADKPIEDADTENEEENFLLVTKRIMEGPIPQSREGRIDTLIKLGQVQVHSPFYYYSKPTPEEKEDFQKKEKEVRNWADTHSGDELAEEIIKKRQEIHKEIESQRPSPGTIPSI